MLLASNMISVGVDIERLGLMVVAGQPRSAAEYIQASSRVGRRPDRPGLVVTCFSLHKPRDRSHYERFTAFHDSFYRSVEAASLTPFSGPGLDRGLAGALVALARHGTPELAPPEGAMALPAHRAAAERAVEEIAARAAGQPGVADEAREAVAAAVRERGAELIAAWERLVAAAPDLGFQRVYSRFEENRQRPLLRSALDGLDGRDGPPSADERRFTAPTSMRDVEPVTHLWLAPGSGAR